MSQAHVDASVGLSESRARLDSEIAEGPDV